MFVPHVGAPRVNERSSLARGMESVVTTSLFNLAAALDEARPFDAPPIWIKVRGPLAEPAVGDLVHILDSARLALPRPPNLESKYQRLRISCQEKNAKCG